MTKAQRKKAREAFLALADSLPELPTSLMATAHEPAPSKEALAAAQVLVGAVDPESIAKVAAGLDTLLGQVAALRRRDDAERPPAGRTEKRRDGRG